MDRPRSFRRIFLVKPGSIAARDVQQLPRVRWCRTAPVLSLPSALRKANWRSPAHDPRRNVAVGCTLLAVAVSLCGCAHPWWRPCPVPEIRNADAGRRATPEIAAHGTSPNTDSGAPSTSDSETLVELLSQIDSIQELDKQSKQQLLADLEQTEPSLWPAMIQQFRAALAYRRQLEQRDRMAVEAEYGPKSTADNAVTLSSAVSPVDQEPLSAASGRASTPPTATPVSHETLPRETSNAGRQDPAPNGPAETSENGPAEALAAQDHAGHAAVVSPSRVARPHRAEPTGAAAAAPLESESAPPAGEADNPDGETDWRGHLRRAIMALEQENQDVPRHTDEVGRHAALRMLYLAAGRRNDALQSIEGIPPAQQDFWSRQLYGLAAYLDDAQQNDSGRRATAARRHLQEAVDKLGEMATLEVRNLEFCTEVSSFGVFKPFENKEFVAGQEVLLYAEIDNFRSVPTEKGYCTALRTSYEILDARGLRVDEHEFATTEDFCQNRRRDFFMRYFIRLPDRIYEGRYTLQLTIEDVKGHKIGQSSIEFQIKDA